MYELKWLNDKLLLIIWQENATQDIIRKFLAELHNILNREESPFYIMTDLRKGQINDPQLLKKLKYLIHHRNWAGSTAFCNNPISNLNNTTFQVLNPIAIEKNSISNTPEEAIGILELLEPSLTASIDFEAVLAPGSKVQ